MIMLKFIKLNILREVYQDVVNQEMNILLKILILFIKLLMI